ncbi:MAG: hypothetical protein WBC98_04455, partial [Candidatus Zixiibacteriota bacterium]
MRYISTIFVFILVCALVVPAVAQQSPPEIPDTQAGKLLSRLLEAFNSGDENQWTGFIKNHWKEKEGSTFERRLEFFTMVYADVGGLILHRIEESDDYFVSALLQAKPPTGPFEWVMMSL